MRKVSARPGRHQRKFNFMFVNATAAAAGIKDQIGATNLGTPQ